MPQNQVSPVAPKERMAVLDVLRGFALFGILCINILAFANPGTPPGFGFRGAWWDVGFFAAIIALVESKFFTLFSGLFGLGFALQMVSAEKQNAGVVPRFLRRLLALALFGVAHIVLLWDGDILLLYALVGLALLGFRHTPPARLLVWIRWLLAVPLALYSLGFLGLIFAQAIPESAKALNAANQEFSRLFANEAQNAAHKIATGDCASLLLERVKSYGASAVLLFTRIPTVLAMFLIGLYVGKTGIITSPNKHLKTLKKMRFWGWALGLPLAALVAFGYFSLPPIASLVVLFFNQALVGILLSVAYATTLVLRLTQGDPNWFTTMVGNVGRLGLSNYLMQSLICSLVFNGYGLGLAGKLSPLRVFTIAIAVYVFQMLCSTFWLRHFRFGLMEWLWRCITYWRWQALV